MLGRSQDLGPAERAPLKLALQPGVILTPAHRAIHIAVLPSGMERRLVGGGTAGLPRCECSFGLAPSLGHSILPPDAEGREEDQQCARLLCVRSCSTDSGRLGQRSSVMLGSGMMLLSSSSLQVLATECRRTSQMPGPGLISKSWSPYRCIPIWQNTEDPIFWFSSFPRAAPADPPAEYSSVVPSGVTNCTFCVKDRLIIIFSPRPL
jgi:hypothetical protein